MNQRLEHMRNALADAYRILRDVQSKSAGNGRPQEELDAAHLTLSIQSAQLNQLISEVREVHAGSAKALEGINQEVSVLSLTLSDFHKSPEAGSAHTRVEGTSPFSSLQKSLHDLHQLVGQGVGLIGQVRAFAEEANTAAALLTGNIKGLRNISRETHLKAINAILKSAKLGSRGRPLEVLAQEMSRLSDQSHFFVENVEDILESVSSSARDLQQGESGRADMEDSTDAATSALDAAMDELEKTYAQFGQDAALAIASARALLGTITSVRGELDFFSSLASELEQNLLQLDTIRSAIDATNTSSRLPTDAGIEELMKRYTMQRERIVHQSAISLDHSSEEVGREDLSWFEPPSKKASPAAADPSCNRAPSEDEEEDNELGDNVDLF
jgi:methyl-accepting chemotaxis protein